MGNRYLSLDKYAAGLFDIQRVLRGLNKAGIDWKAIEHSFLHRIIEGLMFREFLGTEFNFKVSIPGSCTCLGVVDEYDILGADEV